MLSATSASGQLSAQDDESSASLHYQLLSGTVGLTIATDGTFYFDLSNAAYRAAAQGEDFPVSASWRVSDAHGAVSEASLAFTLTGNNEAPYSINSSAAATEDGAEGGGLSSVQRGRNSVCARGVQRLPSCHMHTRQSHAP